MANKLILINVDEDIHEQYKALLKRRGKGERIRYKLGNAANEEMIKALSSRVTESGSVLAVKIDEFYDVNCPYCGYYSRLFDVFHDGTQKCIDCGMVLHITKPNDCVNRPVEAKGKDYE